MGTRGLIRDSVLTAIAKCDAMGEAAFLAHHGYRASTRFVLTHEGRLYPSKAILGVAMGRRASEFSGGAAHTVKVLRGLGFEVIERGAAITALGAAVLLLAAALPSFPVPAQAQPELRVAPVAVYASGSNHRGEIAGFAAIGRDIGVAAPEVNADAERELLQLAGSDVAVFVDSGAFSEVAFGPEGPAVVKPISDASWLARLALYERLAKGLGGQLSVVAPDRVGDQAVTLERLARYAPAMRRIAALGAHVLVPVQRGALSQAEFYRQAVVVLGLDHVVPALPCKKAATSVDEARAFAQAVQPRTIHLLGLGARSRLVNEYLSAIVEAAPEAHTTVSLDSNVITAHVGRAGGVRRLTACTDVAATMTSSVAEKKALAIVLAFGDPWVVGEAAVTVSSTWAATAARKAA